MIKTFLTKDGERIAKIGREKKIYHTAESCYFIWEGRRYNFDNIPSLHYPVMYEDEAGKMGVIGEFIDISFSKFVYVEIDDGGECVQLWEVV